MDSISLLKETYDAIADERKDLIYDLDHWQEAVNIARNNVSRKQTEFSIAVTADTEADQKLLVAQGLLDGALPDRPEILLEQYQRVLAGKQEATKRRERQSKGLDQCREILKDAQEHLAEVQKRMIGIDERRDATMRQIEQQRSGVAQSK